MCEGLAGSLYNRCLCGSEGMKSSLTNNLFDYASLNIFSGFILNMTRFSFFEMWGYGTAYLAFQPPSIEIMFPVIKPTLSSQRKSTVCATSRGLPNLPIG